MFNPQIDEVLPTRRRMALTLMLVWVGWFIVNLAPNGLYYIAARTAPGLRLPAEILYFTGVSTVGIIVPYHLCCRWDLALDLLPERKSVSFWIGSALFLVLAIFLGIEAMSDQGMTLGEAFSYSLTWILAPLPLLIPTMIAYTLLWYGLMLRGWERVLGNSRWATLLSVIIGALLYGLYHFASIDEITTLSGMIDEIVITTLIGIGFGLYVALTRSLLVAFLVNWMLNWFVFTPVGTFHPPIWRWPIGLGVLLGIWLLYRYGWVESSSS